MIRDMAMNKYVIKSVDKISMGEGVFSILWKGKKDS